MENNFNNYQSSQPQPQSMPTYPTPGQPVQQPQPSAMPSYPQPGQPTAQNPAYQEQNYDYNYGSAYQPSYAPAPKVDDSSILTLGILSLVFGGIIGFILGTIGFNKANRYGVMNLAGKAKVGRTLCKVGRILSVITIVIYALYFVIFALGFMDGYNSYNYMALLMPFLF